MTYAEQLKDPRWQRKRLIIFERDGWACVACSNTNETLHVHHKYYAKGKKPWEYPDGDLETLCSTCHKNKHGINECDEAEDRQLFRAHFMDCADRAFSDTCAGKKLLDYGFFTDAAMELFMVQSMYSEHPSEVSEAEKRFVMLVELMNQKKATLGL